MKHKIEILPSVAADVYRLAANLRDADRNEVEALGIEPRAGIRKSFRHAILRKTYYVDGEIAAMSGLCGSMLGDVGDPYLMTSLLVERVPVSFVKLARIGIEEMLQHKSRLENYVIAEYRGACRLIEVLGFTLEAPEPGGPMGKPFRRFWITRASGYGAVNSRRRFG